VSTPSPSHGPSQPKRLPAPLTQAGNSKCPCQHLLVPTFPGARPGHCGRPIGVSTGSGSDVTDRPSQPPSPGEGSYLLTSMVTALSAAAAAIAAAAAAADKSESKVVNCHRNRAGGRCKILLTSESD
jgi:hypothetical protein